MTATVQRRGRYSLFETPRQNRILALDNEEWFAWIEGQQGEILVHSERDHEREQVLQEGEFFLVAFENDPSFTDVPHLFLERGDEFQEVILPNGLPTEADEQKRVVGTDKTVDRAELHQVLGTDEDGGKDAGSDQAVESPSRGDRELPIPDYDELSVRGAKVRLDDLTADQLRVLRKHEEANKRRKTLIHEIDRRVVRSKE